MDPHFAVVFTRTCTMFHRLGKRKMSAPDEASQHLKELRQTVEQLREQLEEEKRSRKRVQNDKVRSAE